MNNFFKNDDFQLDEILFQGKNREYGAYALRHDANKILTKALFVGIAFFATVAITPFVINSFKTEPIVHETGSGEHVFVEVPITKDIEKPKPVEPNVVKPLVDQKTIDTSVPTPVAHLTQKEKPGVKTNDYDTAVPGLVDKGGEVPTVKFTPPVVTSSGEGQKPIIADPPIVKPKTNEPVIAPDKEAKFDGGIDAFRDKFQNKFDGSEFDGTGESLKTTLTFIVEKDGSISNVKANGKDVNFNSEALRAIKAVKGKWTPAQLDGESVRSYFTFPVSMKFE